MVADGCPGRSPRSARLVRQPARRLDGRRAQSEAPVTPALELSELVVTLDGPDRTALRALDRISLSVAPGEILGLVGESGAGKSLTGSAVSGLMPAAARIAAGEIRVDGTRIDNLPRSALRRLRGRRIGAIVQDALSALDPLYSVGDQLAETIATHSGARSWAEAQARAVAWLGAVGIPAPEINARALPQQLSGGMRQRVVVALALCAGPCLVIADEPTTALDPSVQAQIIDLMMRQARRENTAFLLITHDMGIVAEAADRVAVMYAGRIVETGAVADVLARPKHPYTRGLIGSIPALSERVARLHQIEGSMPRLGFPSPACPFAPRCPRVFGRCRSERPELMAAERGEVACWLWPADADAPQPQGATADA
ncbi:MAG: ABC transporter ATP-binding protein [Acetobacteraceae bacterium]|nr:ABC transporter ATP-binding protein [Acetobacteraceae bacterium]